MDKKIIYTTFAVIFFVTLSLVAIRPAEALTSQKFVQQCYLSNDLETETGGVVAYTCPNTYTGACTSSKCSDGIGPREAHACEWKCVGGTYQPGHECGTNMCYGAGCHIS